MNDTVHEISAIYSEVERLRSQTEEDANMIALLTRQHELRSMELTKMAADHADEIRKLRQRCDVAVRRETEIEGALKVAAKGLLEIAGRINSSIRKLAGDETPPKMPEREAPQIEDNRLPVLAGDDRLPPAEFAPRRGSLRAEVMAHAEADLDDGLADLVSRLPRRL